MIKVDFVKIVNSRTIRIGINEVIFNISTKDWYEKKISSNQEIDGSLYQFVLTKSVEHLAKNWGLKLLGYRPYTKQELSQKINIKISKWLTDNKLILANEIIATIITQTICKFEDGGFLDDHTFVDTYCRIHNKKSTAELKYLLRQKGVETDIIDSYFGHNSDRDQLAIKYILARKIKQGTVVSDCQKNKLISGLVRKGFPLYKAKKEVDDWIPKK